MKIKILALFLLALVATGSMLFIPAGTLAYWQAWAFLGTLFIPCAFVVAYLQKYDPKLLERRMRFKEKEARQKTIIKIANLIFFTGFLIPGLDFRFGWSHVPTALVVIANIIIFLSYLLVFFVFRENSHTSRIVEVEKGQKVISTGPYSVVRHPMYTGVIAMYGFMPVALGSYWALICFAPVVAIVVFRALDEEKVLLRDLEGYADYLKKVKYRLIPGIW